MGKTGRIIRHFCASGSLQAPIKAKGSLLVMLRAGSIQHRLACIVTLDRPQYPRSTPPSHRPISPSSVGPIHDALLCFWKAASSASSAQNSVQKCWPLDARQQLTHPSSMGNGWPQFAQVWGAPLRRYLLPFMATPPAATRRSTIPQVCL